jgi:hypothetical protein
MTTPPPKYPQFYPNDHTSTTMTTHPPKYPQFYLKCGYFGGGVVILMDVLSFWCRCGNFGGGVVILVEMW